MSIISSDAHCLNYNFVVVLGEMSQNWGYNVGAQESSFLVHEFHLENVALLLHSISYLAQS